jgi:hypothetical protein
VNTPRELVDSISAAIQEADTSDPRSRVSGREAAVGTGCSSYRTGAAALIAVRWLRSGTEPTERRGSGHHPSSNE